MLKPDNFGLGVPVPVGQRGPGTPGGYAQVEAGVSGLGSVPVAVVLLDLWLSVDDPLSNQSFSQQLNERMYVSGFQKAVPTKPPGHPSNMQIAGPHPRDSHTANLGWG